MAKPKFPRSGPRRVSPSALAVGTLFGLVLLLGGLLTSLMLDLRTLDRRIARLDRRIEALNRTLSANVARLREKNEELDQKAYLAARETERLRRGQAHLLNASPRRRTLKEKSPPAFLLKGSLATFKLPLDQEERPCRGTIAIENHGTRTLRNVRLFLNGRSYFHTTREILKFAVPPKATPKEKAFAIYEFVRRYRYHWWPSESSVNAGAELHNPVKFFNVYGYGFCDDAATNFAMLCRSAGLPARVWFLNGHVVAETDYDGASHVFDPDGEVFYLSSDNRAVASLAQVEREPFLALRTPFGLPEYEADRARFAGFYADRGNYLRPLTEDLGHPMSLDLRPGERFVQHWRVWDRAAGTLVPPVQLEMTASWWKNRVAPQFHAADYTNQPPFVGRAEFHYEPSFSRANARDLFTEMKRLGVYDDGKHKPLLCNDNPDAPGLFTMYSRVPFVLVGGRFEAEFVPSGDDDTVRIDILRRPDVRTEVETPISKTFTGQGGPRVIALDFGRVFRDDNPFATYEYGAKVTVHCRRRGAFGLRRIRLHAACQTTPFCPWRPRPGANAVRVTAESKEDPLHGSVRFQWLSDEGIQRFLSAPQAERAKTTPDGRVLLRWRPPETSDKRPPAAYHVTVSPRPDFAWPVAPCFDVDLPGVETVWTSPAGFLRSGAAYYWRVYAKEAHGYRSAASAPRRIRAK